jgi:hypothetical protein
LQQIEPTEALSKPEGYQLDRMEAFVSHRWAKLLCYQLALNQRILMNKNNSLPIGVCAAALAATGFVAGFFGPIALNPDANQGPLLGLFITGPGGALAGLVLGWILKLLPIDAKRKWTILFGVCIVSGIAILYFCLPEPKVRGYIVDAKITACAAPVERIDAAIEHWNKRIAAVTWAPPRAGWKEDVQRMLRDDGVVVEIQASRQRRILEHRQPWNHGRIGVSAWESRIENKTFFARYAGSDCASYANGGGLLYVANGQGSKDWPPSDLQDFLEIALIEPVPGEYSNLVDR